MKRITATQVEHLSKIEGRHHIDDNLYLQVRKSGKPAWIFRYQSPHGSRRDMSLGPLALISLADARQDAEKWRGLLVRDIDPIEARRANREALKKEHSRRQRTLRIAATEYVEFRRATWRNDKQAQQWMSSLQHLGPLMDEPVASLTSAGLLRQLEPLVAQKRETSRRVRQRIEAIFDREILHGHLESNPALPLARAMRAPVTVKPMAAIAWRELPDFMGKVRDSDMSQSVRLGMEWLILSAARTSEVLKATWNEFDEPQSVWRIPATRMKTGVAHEIPITKRHLEILDAMACQRGPKWDWIFPSPQRRVQSMSSNVFLQSVKRMGLSGKVTMHGMRSAFSSWAHETQGVRSEVIEAALAHREADAVKAAYNRASYWDQRVQLALAWASFVTGEPALAQ